ncbi:MAG: M48 family metalloprotease [Acidobacteria bacterium]|nr:M48 family metalloprotease [Acidobacteriota bacterium]
MKRLFGLLAVVLSGQSLSVEKEEALGRGIAAEVRKSTRLLELPDVEAYVQRIGERLAALAQETEVAFEVVQMDAVEPIGLLGGTVFVPAAFFLLAENEGEFAGMLAHAMGHVVLRHGVMKPDSASIPPIFMGGWDGVHADPRGRESLIPMGFQKKIGGFEIEADEFGAALAEKAGFGSAGLRQYRERIRTAGPVARESTGSDEYAVVRDAVRTALQRPVRKAPSLRR